MVFAWSATETIRYPFYACGLLGLEPYPLLYLRYTTFYLLYPLGASSEAFIIYSTLPKSSPIPSLQSWMQGMWNLTDYVRGVLFCIWWPGAFYPHPNKWVTDILRRPVCDVHIYDQTEAESAGI